MVLKMSYYVAASFNSYETAPIWWHGFWSHQETAHIELRGWDRKTDPNNSKVQIVLAKYNGRLCSGNNLKLWDSDSVWNIEFKGEEDALAFILKFS